MLSGVSHGGGLGELFVCEEVVDGGEQASGQSWQGSCKASSSGTGGVLELSFPLRVTPTTPVVHCGPLRSGIDPTHRVL